MASMFALAMITTATLQQHCLSKAGPEPPPGDPGGSAAHTLTYSCAPLLVYVRAVCNAGWGGFPCVKCEAGTKSAGGAGATCELCTGGQSSTAGSTTCNVCSKFAASSPSTRSAEHDAAGAVLQPCALKPCVCEHCGQLYRWHAELHPRRQH